MEGCSDGGHGTRLVFVNAVDKEREKRRKKSLFRVLFGLVAFNANYQSGPPAILSDKLREMIV